MTNPERELLLLVAYLVEALPIAATAPRDIRTAMKRLIAAVERQEQNP